MEQSTTDKKLPKNHHYIPQFYLRGFSLDGKHLHILDKKASGPDLMYRRQTIESIAYEKQLYTYRNTDGEKETLEDMFGEIEGKAKISIEKLSEKKKLTLEERSWLALFISLIQLRTPASKNEMLGADQQAREKIMRMSFNAPRDFIKKRFEAIGHKLNDEELDDTINFAQDEKRSKVVVDYPPEYWIRRMLLLSSDLALLMSSFVWEVRHADKPFAFLTSDNPFLLIPGEKPDPFHGVGLITPKAKKILPLKANLCLIMHDPKSTPIQVHTIADKAFSRKINEYTVRHANRFIFSPEKGKIEKIANTKKELLVPWENMYTVS